MVKSKKNPTVSVIIPVYNVGPFLRRCVKSVLGQTYKNLQIILVDDGSTDDSGKQCDSFKDNDSRIIVVHKKNGGLSSARNAGIKESTGEYICFVDSDDYIEKEFVERLLSASIANETKISQCNVALVSNNGDYLGVWKNKYAEPIIDGRSLIDDTFKSDNVQNIVVWNRLYKSDLLSSKSFEEGRIHEDEFFTYKILFGNNVSIVNEELYMYVQNPNGIMHGGKHLNAYKDVIDAYNEKITFFSKKDMELCDKSINAMLCIMPSLIAKYYSHDHRRNALIRRDLKKEYKYLVNKYSTYGLKKPFIRLLKTKATIVFPALYCLFNKVSSRW